MQKREVEEEMLGKEAYLKYLKSDETNGLVKNGKVWLVWKEVGGRERLIGVGGRREEEVDRVRVKQEREKRREDQSKRRMREGGGMEKKDAERMKKEKEKRIEEDEKRKDGVMSRKLLQKEKEVEREWRMRIEKAGRGGEREEKLANFPNLNLIEMNLPLNNSFIKKTAMKPTSAKMSYSEFIQKVNNKYKFNGKIKDKSKVKEDRERKKKEDEKKKELIKKMDDEEENERRGNRRKNEKMERRDRGGKEVLFDDIAGWASY